VQTAWSKVGTMSIHCESVCWWVFDLALYSDQGKAVDRQLMKSVLQSKLWFTFITTDQRNYNMKFPGHNERGTIIQARNYCGVVEKSQQCHKYFFQYSTFASERPQVRIWGRQTCFLPRAPSNLVMPL